LLHQNLDQLSVKPVKRITYRKSGFFLRYKVLSVAVGLLTGLLCLTYGIGHSLDLGLRELRDGLHQRKASGDVVIAEIDSRSLAEIDRWPWPRSIHGHVIDQLSAARAHTIAFDVDFSSPSRPAEDAAMAAALARAGGSVILPTFRQFERSNSAKVYENLPIPAFKNNAFLASVNIVPDADGMVRHYETGVVTSNVMRPSIAGLMAGASSKAAQNLIIDYSIDPNSIPRLSYVDIMKGRVPATRLAGKRVLIGATAVEMGDRYATPGHGVIPGVIIQAMAAETLLQDSNLTNYGGVPLFALALLILFASGRLKGTALRASVLAAGTFGVLGLPLLLEILKLATLDPSSGIIALFSGSIVLCILSVQRAFWRNKTKDTTTGLPNAFAFGVKNRGAKSSITAAARIQHYGEVSMLLGADQTAEWVRQIARRLALATTEKTIYRVEENALVWLFDARDSEDLPDRFAALTAVFNAPIIVGARSIEVTLSYGVSQAEADDPRVLSAQALLAADRAAEQGIVWDMHNDLHGAEVDWKMSLLGELDQAMTNGDIWVAYQPQASISSGQIIGAEALVRWNHPARGVIAPDHFIPTIEREGRMKDITLFVLDQVLEAIQKWDKLGLKQNMSINISASLLSNAKFYQAAARRIVQSNIERSRLVLEVTESATLADPENAIENMNAFRSLGVGLSIDDYGTGQSTLTYLKRLPITEIKIDKSFISDLPNCRNDQILVRSSIALAHDLGFNVVAEGIENAECMALLATYGCDTAQGWHIGKAMPIDALTELLVEPLALAA
jgi:EAL domain-containing protein (putative c-di-GMP-specific phosphodiesterase class I)/CHASE2 domain-containing sensor protein